MCTYKLYHKAAVSEHGLLHKTSEGANIHTDNLTFTLSQISFHTGTRGPQNNHTLPHRALISTLKRKHKTTSQSVSLWFSVMLCVAAGGGLVGTSTAVSPEA